MNTEQKLTFSNIKLNEHLINAAILCVINQKVNRDWLIKSLKLDTKDGELLIEKLLDSKVISETTNNNYELLVNDLDSLVSVFYKIIPKFDSNCFYISYVEMLEVLNKQKSIESNNEKNKKQGFKRFFKRN